MTVITCGRTNLSERAEEITRVLRQEQGYRTDGGCGRGFDLDNPLQHMRVYRCVECARWLCEPCIKAHFEESRHDKEARPDGRAGTPDAARAARAADIRDTCSGRAAIRGVTAGSLSGPHARTTTDRTAR